ncbi:stimulated by retinoic acid gene 6 protein-like [Branchiostoma lanceolatum]|uniref:stimulated by retinoic acid gene 6 protein-like n=1 Tax=Branchiostoma lanceolatum TaxID=7740 RepID=UPI0034531252
MYGQNGTNGTEYHCLIRDDLFQHFSLIPAVVIISILSWIEGRNQQRTGTKCSRLRFSLPVPVDFFDTHSNRWSYAVAFGVTTTACISLFTDAYSSNYLPYLHDWPLWSQLIIAIVSVFELGVNYYPFFACMSCKVKLVGAILGFLYSATWFSVKVVFEVNCAGPIGQGAFQFLGTNGNVFNIIVRLPTVVCLFLLVAKFAIMIEGAIEEQVRLRKGPQQGIQGIKRHKKLMHFHHALHVKRLLGKPQETPELPWYRKIWYRPDPAFRFSARVITTVVVTFLCLYEVMVIDLFFGNLLWNDVRSLVNATINHTVVVDIDGDFWDVFITSWNFTGIFTGFILFLYLLRILACYRKHMQRLYKGDYKWLPDFKQSSSWHVFQSLKYSGAQIAYMIWGYIIIQVILMVLILIFYVLVKNPDFVLSSLEVSLPPMVVSIAVLLVQWLLGKFVFLQKSKDEEEQPLAFEHFKAYQNFAYFMFFFNIIVGFFFCFSRVIISLIFGVLLLSRIDRTVLMEGFEQSDIGYLFYLSMVRIEVAHTHPVLLSFCQLLLDTTTTPKRNGRYSSYVTVQRPLYETKPRWRWHLAYTLLRNPQLKELRKKVTKREDVQLINPTDRATYEDIDSIEDTENLFVGSNDEVLRKLSFYSERSDSMPVVTRRQTTDQDDVKLLSL